MSEPIVFISHFKIKEGKLDGLMQLNQKVTESIEANKPGTLAFLQYINEDRTELSVIHIFPDADSFDQHVAGVDERVKASLEFIVPTRREIYGLPSDGVMAMLKPPDGSGMTVDHLPQITGGYIRFKPE